MINPDDLPEFHRWCQKHGLSYEIFFMESSEETEVEVISAAPVECLFVKRCHDLKWFMDKWEKIEKT